MNKPSAVSLSVLFVMVLTLGMIPNVFARIVWTKEPPFIDAYANAWRGNHSPERETWWARASADKSTGVMESNIHAYMDVGGYLNTYFVTAMTDLVTISSSGTLFITGAVFLHGHAHIYGIAFIFGAYEVTYSLDLWLTVDDRTTGTPLLAWKVNTWEDHELGAPTWITDRGYDFNFDYTIPQTSVPVEDGHTYKVTVKLVGWAGASAAGVAAAQSDIDFESENYHMKLKWLTYDAPGSEVTEDPPPRRPGAGGCPTLFVWDGSQYVEEATLDIHADSDVTLQHTIAETLVPDKNSYKLSLRELDNFTSHIDQVKLFAVDSDGEMYEAHLTNATHSELGDVKELLLHDDETRVDMTPEHTIDLKFTVPNIDDDVACFIFEINGYNQKTPGGEP